MKMDDEPEILLNLLTIPLSTMKKKIVLIRFSSFGDIVQSLAAVNYLKKNFPECELHFVTKREFKELIALCPLIDKIWVLDSSQGLAGLLQLAYGLTKENFEFIYDSHANIRSYILRNILFPLWKNLNYSSHGVKVVVRKKYRIKRFLLFVLRKNFFPWPFRGMISYQKPLKKMSGEFILNENFEKLRFSETIKQKVHKELSNYLNKKKVVTLIPSSAWELKKWPTKYFMELIASLEDYRFILLGGPTDLFLNEIKKAFNDRVINMAGRLSLVESAFVVNESKFVVSGDTGLIHVADYLNTPGILLIGPSAFGYTSGKSISVVEEELWCKPCSKDGRNKCVNKEYQKCLVDIKPQRVIDIIKSSFRGK